ncbi:LOW QUALITY PROTEIN: odorant receptor 59a [Drosophila busckii]|uniref:LOW QUALITY PROTEIN: odorant receptor 59a n=1 Tax=Drosophila busckii TaxID=30019 RepID=UPI001432A1EA|nr:LOW QUALITY PROTEIN: odorant receptor 59a [Drosophila busckii]
MARAYFFFYALAMPMQIFPTCYYATDVVLWFGKLHYAAFSCNWVTQSRSFKRKMMLFVERSLKNVQAVAGGMIPIHVDAFFVELFSQATVTDKIRNITSFIGTLACSLKILIFSYNLQKVRHMEHLLELLDSRIKGSAQLSIYNQLSRQLRNIIYVFICMYLPVGISSEMSFIFQEERKLLYPGWFPYDWHNSTLNFNLTNIYQFAAMTFAILESYVNDSIPAVMLCLISAHTKMLYKRIADIGTTLKSDTELEQQLAETELEACITDHKHLLELFQTVESFISWPMFIQFVASALNICISIAALLFFVTEPMARAYFFFYALAMPMQIFLTCYYGTDSVLWFGKLPYAAFSCNWVTQSRSFKRKLMLFVERSLKNSELLQGGMSHTRDAFLVQ